MSRIAIIHVAAAGLLMTLVTAAESADKHSTEIPLNEIWSYRMPDTKSVRDLEPPVKLKELSVDAMVKASIVHRIYNSLSRGKIAAPAFVIEGTGAGALKNAEAVFMGADPPEKLKSGTDLTLVFYTVLGREVRISSIQKGKDRITIKYHFNMRQANGMWADFALIPLGKLEPSVVDVEIVEQPIDGENPSGLEDRVSSSTTFQVE